MISISTPPDADRPQNAAECLERNKPILLEALRRIGAVRASIAYHGGGDEGFEEQATAERCTGTAIDLQGEVRLFEQQNIFDNGQWQSRVELLERPLGAALSDYASQVLNQHYGSWEDGDGGYGEVIFDVVSDAVRIEHHAYFTDSDYSETVL